ncbi:hypothetical protein KP509_34G022400 [Ceratopteris richardii]|uniref:DNA polymerase n=1 Tax=Ceratopteris richardii TaxID=49495 RepID=A0A8T2QJI7_CERRI|nr:hypothetical protein KP509_34G022400 [Ceratopteris richardii]
MLFAGIRAYFVEAGIQPRRLKIWCEKFCQLGGMLENHFSHDVTHAFASDIDKLRDRIPLRKLERHHVKALKYEWIQDSLRAGSLQALEPYVLKLEDKSKIVQGGHGHVDTSHTTGQAAQEQKDRKASSSDLSTTMSSAEFGSDDTGLEAISTFPHETEEAGSSSSPTFGYCPPNLNENITEPFMELRDIYKDALGDDHRSFSYHKAISVLEKLPFKIENVDQIKGLPTIGKSLREHINEILRTGSLSKLENFKNDKKVQALRLFSSIWGIGPATALKLYEKGYRTLDDLKKEPSLTASQRVGLQFYKDLTIKIPRHEVMEMESLVRKVAEHIEHDIIVVCGGSYRRGKAFCNDMDFIITHPDGSSHEGFLAKLVAALKEKDFLAESLLISDTHSTEKTDSGVDTYYGLCKYPGRELRHRIDFKVYSFQMYPFGLIAWTGNDVLNRKLRMLAEAKGYRLDDTGLYPFQHKSSTEKGKRKGPSIALKTERDVFDFLGFPWLEPHERNL